MDEDRIGLVLAKTSELRSKIISCIHRTASNVESESGEGDSKEREAAPDAGNKENDAEEEAESLLNIKDALESLEAQLSSLQALQQQQWYEKEAALAEIQYSQKKLLKQLKEYKGHDLEVIHEAMAFASETEDSNDLLLPPYQNGYAAAFKNLHDIACNHHKPESQYEPGGRFKSVKTLMATVAKTAITIVGVISILSLAGVRKQGSEMKLVDDERGSSVECPPGKVAVVENGETRCVVKERVEVPFECVVGRADVSYGCG